MQAAARAEERRKLTEQARTRAQRAVEAAAAAAAASAAAMQAAPKRSTAQARAPQIPHMCQMLGTIRTALLHMAYVSQTWPTI